MNKFSRERFVDERQQHRINERIRISPVMVIQDDHNLGVMPTAKALDIARQAELDLVEVSPQSRPPVCRILDYSKFKYDQQIKEKEKKKQPQMKMKTMKFSPSIDDHDIDIKVGQCKKFLEEGDKVLLKVEFYGRQKAHKEKGGEVLRKAVEKLSEFGTPQKGNNFIDGKFSVQDCFCIVEPKKA